MVLALLVPLGISQGLGTGLFAQHIDPFASGYHFDGKVWRPNKPQTAPPVSGHALTARQVTPRGKHVKPLGTYRGKAPVWPKAGTATVRLTHADRTSAGTVTKTPDKAPAGAPTEAPSKTPAGTSTAKSSASPTSSVTPSGTASASPGASSGASASATSGANPSASASSPAPSADAGAGAAPQSSVTPQSAQMPVEGPVKAAGLPVWLAPAKTGGHAKTGGQARKAAAAGVPRAVDVSVASHKAALRAGANGMLLTLRPAGGSAGGKVEVVVDYAQLAKAYGGGYGSRLELVQLPSCVLTTPQDAACQKRTPVRFTNRVGANQLTATVTLPGAPSAPSSSAAASGEGGLGSQLGSLAPMSTTSTSSSTTLAVTSSTSGSQGDYSATSLNPAGAWKTSPSGAFTYSYPIDVPSGADGSAPAVSLGYDSQSQDGETSARNSQASWVGDGWSYEPGFVERSYRSCGSLVDSSDKLILKGSGDECWGGDNAILSFGSHSGRLVPDGVDSSVTGEIKQWRLQGDDGTLVQELSGAPNGLQDGLYFRVLTTDGTAAYFGAEHAPSGTGGSATIPSSPADSSTASAWGVPVLHPVSGDPCYNSTDGKKSKCAKPEGWRWNLDFVVAPSGSVQRYGYARQSNYYDLGGGQAASGSHGTLTSYTRGGALTSIRYGYTLADEKAGRKPSAEVDFTPAQRCQTTSTFTDCSAGNLKDSTATHWPDVPWDLHCDSTDTTVLASDATSVPSNVCIVPAPTFWTTTRLSDITTKVHVKDSSTDAMEPVDSYHLHQVYSDAGGTVDPVTGTSVDPKDAGQLQAVMWLQTVQHTGKDTYGNGNSDIALNKVAFTGTEIDNRVNDASPSAPPLYRPRIASVQTETGESIAVDYNLNPCAGLTLTMADADTNTHSCYPVYWTVAGASKPTADWFNLTTVREVTVSDLTVAAQYKPDSQNIPAGSEPQTTRYTYSGPAWHRNDSSLTDDQYRTWDQFRGFKTVTVQTGTAPEPVTQTTTHYLQGMDGDYLADGTRRSVTRTATVGGSTVETVTDSAQLAGTVLDTDTYTKAGGTINAVSVNGPFTFTTTAHAAQTAWSSWNTTDNTGTKPALSTLPDQAAYRMKTSRTDGYALLTDGTWRHTRTDSTYDSQGRPSTVDAHGDVSDTSQEKCTTTTYASPPSANPMMLDYPDRTTAVAGACGTAVSATSLIADQKVYYTGDGTLSNLGTFGALSSTGRPTATQVADGFTSGAETWRTTQAVKYDGAGRVSATTDATGQTTTTAYSPAWSSAGGNTNPTSYTTTNSQGWQVSTTLSPLRGLPTEDVDVNGRKTDMTYDALGRRTAVWLPGRDKSAGQSADKTFLYSIDPGAVAAPGGTITQPGAPSSVTTHTLREDGTYSTSVTIYDGMLQPRQTQTPALGDSSTGRIISDTFYDSHGWLAATYAPYSEPTTDPSTTLYAANENQIPAETTTTYDGQGRPTASTLWHQAVKQWSTTTSYPGADEATSTGPAGGRTIVTYKNALGQTTKSVVRNTGSTVTLTGGQIIPSGTSLTSDSTRLEMRADGSLVLSSLATNKTLKTLFAATSTSAGAYAKFTTDGNLAVYSPSGTQLWSTGLAATSGSVLKLQNDADLAVYNSAGTSLWSSGTAGQATAADASTRYTYTTAGQTSTVKDSAGNTWSYSYNLLGQLTSQSDPNTGTTTYDKYDTAGNLLQFTDPRGQVLSYHYDWDNRKTAEYASAYASSPDAAKQLAAWSYDTLAKGYPTSGTRYVGGASGKAYTQAVTGYNTAYQPTGSTLTIPASDGFAAAGQSAPPSSGTVTYTLSSSYTPTIGLLNTTTYQADGNLPAEEIGYGYNQDGTLTGFGGFITPVNTPSYLDDTRHDAFGRTTQANYGPNGQELATYAQYDSTTGRLTQTSSMLQTQTSALDVVDYRYNQAGEITAIDDLRDNTTHDTQCFSYDSFQRLTAAWTDTKGITNPGTATPGQVGGCTTSRVQDASTTVGGPAPYWQTYSYDLLGDRTGKVDHDTTGNALANTTQAITYPGTDGTTAATHPDQTGTETVTNPTLGTATQTETHTDTGYSPNVNAGNAMDRKVTTVGPIVTAFTLSSGGKLCVDDALSATTPGNKVQVYTCNGTSAQKWSIGTDHTVRVHGMCLDTTGNATTSGTKVVIDTCNGDPTQQWRTTTSGKLALAANNNLCLTDPSASATKGTQLTVSGCSSSGDVWTTIKAGPVLPGQQQDFTYDAEGHTATVATTQGTHTHTSTYLYDADGGLLEQTASVDGSPRTRVLYLFGGAEQITLDVRAKTFTGLRFYTGPDGTRITRSSTGSVNYEMATTQGTATTAVDAGSLAVTRRAYDPWGNPRGTQPSTWVAPDENHGFLGKPTDPSSGLDLLGARNYDPTTGRFLTPDPLFEAGDPNQMGGYTYAGDNPVSLSDPTGLFGWGSIGHFLTGVLDGFAGDAFTSFWNLGSAFGNHVADGLAMGWNWSVNRSGSSWGLPHLNTHAHPFRTNHNHPFAHLFGVKTNSTSYKAGNWTGFVGGFVADGVGVASKGVEAYRALKALRAARDVEEGVSGGNAAAKGLGHDGGGTPKGPKGDSGGGGGKSGGKPRDLQDGSAAANRHAAEPDSPHVGSEGTKPRPKGCSFSPDTPVLMAHGKTKPIGKIKTGDKVESASPKTGKHQGPRTVQHVWINHDHDLVDVTIRTEDGRKATLHTTANHPFWDDTTHTWVPAGKLHRGDALNTADNGHAHVVTLHATPGAANRWNLTVQQLHTYYVVPGGVPVLVHNTCGPVFRGTTKGYGGSPGVQRAGVTPTSSDPGVATIFATHSEQYGADAVVQIAMPEDVAGVESLPGYIAREAEVQLDMPPTEFAGRASIEIPVSHARAILGRMGIGIPRDIGIDDLNPTLEFTPKLTPEQISQFVEEAKNYGS
ncbi:ricin-type beta-trefoil lectin domain protein [Streptomyces beihaiensis]|uniref:Ricin-type beta-trefoil lectin domain protein n=1 Tax=Streptomyces beihaiensis TaxID=2984495 RepID=A0ABT3TYJ9_9ACTN|nr:ricin-type beta-trefoil lectin domain protein [Streptomyces beihaiensis]MCX3061561.1 ricin-type beta-trefoil lectin domain protein [Streptomyces beihaiensis]